jgi:glycosyltransferase involved in cell wall biosynthesis
LSALISIIIPTRNRAPHLKRALDALLEDEYPYKEIIVCDGASTDDTVNLLKSYEEHVRWVSERDSGEYDARNKGLRMATGDVIKYMSDDDLLLSGTLAYGADYFRSHPDVDILFGQSVWFDARSGHSPVVCDTRVRTEESIRVRNFIRQSKPLVPSETAFFRRRVVERLGFFNPKYIGADYEYWVRAAKAGCRLAISERVFVHYNISDGSGVERKRVRLLFSLLRLAREHGTPWDILYLGLLAIPFRLCVRGAYHILHPLGIFPELLWARWKTRRSAQPSRSSAHEPVSYHDGTS